MKFTITPLSDPPHIEIAYNNVREFMVRMGKLRGLNYCVGLSYRESIFNIIIKGEWENILTEVYGENWMRIHDMQLGLHLANYIIEKGVK